MTNFTITRFAIFCCIAFLYSCSTKFPASLMEMNKPEYLLKHSGPWECLKTQHLELYYGTSFGSKKDVQKIATMQESNFMHIIKLMNLSNPDTLSSIKVWLFESNEEKYKKTQVITDAHSLHEYWSTYYRKGNETGAHELGHVIVNNCWGYIPNDSKFQFMMSEGWAFFVDEGVFWKRSFFDEKIKKFIIENEKFHLASIITNPQPDYSKNATISASFIKYLIQTFGIEKFSQLWKGLVNQKEEKAFNDAYGKSFSVLENEFYAFLNI